MFESIFSLILSAGGINSVFTILIIAILGVAVLIYVLFKTKSALKLSLGPVKICLGSNKEDVKLDEKTLDLLIDTQQDNIKEMIKFEDDLLKRQMNYTEQKLSQLKFHLVSKYDSALSKKLGKGQDSRSHKDYRNYQILATMLNRDLLDKIFKSAFVENHLSEMDGLTWEHYLTDKTNFIMNHIGEFMDVMYGEGKILSRQETAEIERGLYDDVVKIVREIFDNIREINLNFEEELGKIRSDSRKKILEACRKNGISFDSKSDKQVDDA